MKEKAFIVVRFDADDGKVFDWSNLDEHIIENEDGTTTQDHLYAKTVFIGELDSIDNYVEVNVPVESEE